MAVLGPVDFGCAWKYVSLCVRAGRLNLLPAMSCSEKPPGSDYSDYTSGWMGWDDSARRSGSLCGGSLCSLSLAKFSRFLGALWVSELIQAVVKTDALCVLFSDQDVASGYLHALFVLKHLALGCIWPYKADAAALLRTGYEKECLLFCWQWPFYNSERVISYLGLKYRPPFSLPRIKLLM